MLKFHDSNFPRSILVRMSLTSHEEIGRVGRGWYEDPRYDVRNKSCVSCSWTLENDTTHGQTGSTTPQQTAGRPIRLSLNSMGLTPTPTRMRLSCNFLNVYTIAYRVQYTFTCVHARISNGQVRDDPREAKRACRSSRRTSRPGLSCVSGLWQAEWGSRQTRRRVGVAVGPVEFKLYAVDYYDEVKHGY